MVEFDKPKTAGVLEADEVDIPLNTAELGVPNAFEVAVVEERDGLNADCAPKVVVVLLEEERGFEAAPKLNVGLVEFDANGSEP